MFDMTGSTDHIIGQRLRARRWLIGMTAAEVSGCSGVSVRQIQRYERGVDPVPASHLSGFAAILGVPISFFEAAAAGPQTAEPTGAGGSAGGGRQR